METHTTSLTDLSDAAWRLLEPVLPPPARTGRPRRHRVRTIVNAILSMLRSGCAWRLLPADWPPWKTVFHYFRKWRRDGTWERLHTLLRRRWRVRRGRDPQPSAGSVDSQSVKTTRVGGARGDDGAKKLVGRKRHVLVDTEGLLLALSVHPAASMDRDGIKLLLAQRVRAQLPRRQLLWLDAGDNGRGKGREGKDGVEQTTGWRGETVKAIHRSKRSWVPNDIPPEPIDGSQYLPPPGFHVIPRRWVVARTFAWLSHNCRLSTEYERLTTTSEAWISLAMSRLMLRWLARS